MLDAIKKGLIQTAYLSAWCSHAEEYGGREHGIYGGCRIEEMAPEVPYSEMADTADRVLSRLASAFVADAVFPAFSSVGGYPLLYHGAKDLSYCAECADDPHYRVKTARAYYEGVPYACDGCGVEIESAYGVPESAESEEG